MWLTILFRKYVYAHANTGMHIDMHMHLIYPQNIRIYIIHPYPHIMLDAGQYPSCLGAPLAYSKLWKLYEGVY